MPPLQIQTHWYTLSLPERSVWKGSCWLDTRRVRRPTSRYPYQTPRWENLYLVARGVGFSSSLLVRGDFCLVLFLFSFCFSLLVCFVFCKIMHHCSYCICTHALKLLLYSWSICLYFHEIDALWVEDDHASYALLNILEIWKWDSFQTF